MALPVGQQLGPYEIVSPLGAGGMGEVYRARDTRLRRDVAVKVLPQRLSSDPDLKARFEREARAISSLNHPHICHLYDIGSQDGTDFLVMELLEGETLADRLQRGSIPQNQALEYGIEIAEALEKAHKSGIVHRDLKPGNIMLTKSGAKLLDFGLAKPAQSISTTASDSVETMTKPLTGEGKIVGTFRYMAPEQILGKETDARTDIFALGAVLYEMLTGKRAFEGKSQISVMSAILEKDPEPIASTQPLTPPLLDHVIRRALEKDPERRWQSAADFASELEWVRDEGSSPATLPLSAISRARPRSRTVWPAVVLLIAVAGGIVIGMLLRPRPSRAVLHTVVAPPGKMSLVLMGDNAGPPVLSPDGAYITFTAAGADGVAKLLLHPMDSMESRVLPETDGATFPFWSPDSHSIAFFADGKLKITDVNGGTPQAIADAPLGRGGAWGPGVILFTPDTHAALMRVDPSGGTAVPVTQVDASKHSSHRWPFMLPDGKHFLYLAINHDPAKSENNAIYYASLDGKSNRQLLRSNSNAIYAAGYLIFARGTQLMALPFDPDSGKLSGEARTIASDVANDLSTWHVDASASGGDLLVLGNGGGADSQLIWMDRSGKPLGVIADKLNNLQDARLSPSADRIALQFDTGIIDIWVQDLARGVRTRITFGPTLNSAPTWSPDGTWIAYSSLRNQNFDIYRRRADGSGSEELLLHNDRQNAPVAWSSDGTYLLYLSSKGFANSISNRGQELWALPFVGDRKPFLVVPNLNTQLVRESLSPDGRWLAYVSTESGRSEVYVVPFPGGQGKWQISQNGGTNPEWRSDGGELFYASPGGNHVVAVAVTRKGNSLRFGAPQVLFPDTNAQNPLFDVAPGGNKFVLSMISQQTSQAISVISNWSAELKK